MIHEEMSGNTNEEKIVSAKAETEIELANAKNQL
jgi:hypothetical protein